MVLGRRGGAEVCVEQRFDLRGARATLEPGDGALLADEDRILYRVRDLLGTRRLTARFRGSLVADLQQLVARGDRDALARACLVAADALQ